MLDSIIVWLTTLDPFLFYAALSLCSFLENIVPPVPGDSVVVFGSYLAARGDRSFLKVLVATTLGSEAGFMTYYLLGRLIDPARLAARWRRFLPAARIERARKWFVRWGLGVVLLNRFLSGIRSVISLVSGMLRLPWPRVLVLSTIGCLVWNGLLVRAGFLLGSNWRVVERILADYSRAMLCLVALGIAARVVYLRNRRSSTVPRNPAPEGRG